MFDWVTLIKLLLIPLLPVGVSALLAWTVKRFPNQKLNNFVRHAIIGTVFGVVSILSSVFSVSVGSYEIPLCDAPVLCAGLLFGGPAGIVAGVLGTGYRLMSALLSFGDYSLILWSFSALWAGIVAMIISKFIMPHKGLKWYYGFAVGALCEVSFMLIILLGNISNVHTAFIYIRTCSWPMMLLCGLSVMLSASVVSLFNKTENVKGTEPKKIAHTFQKFLLLVTLSVFCISTVFSFVVQTSFSINDTEKLLRLNISDLAQDIADASNANMYFLASMAADELDSEGEITNATLFYYADFFNVYEMNYVDSDGIIRASTNPELVGFDMRSGEQSSEFMVLLDGETSEYIQPYQPSTFDPEKSLKYGAVTLLNGGFIQIGYDMDQFYHDVARFTVNATDNRHIGETGYIIIVDDTGAIVSGNRGDKGENLSAAGLDYNNLTEDVCFTASPYGEPSYCLCLTAENYTAIGVMPKSEALFSRSVSMYINLFMDAIIFALLFLLVYKLVDKIIVRNVRRINKSLSEITEGNLDVVMDVNSNEEFARLSDDINKTVVTLKGYISEAEARIDKELDFARNIQLSALPHVFPPFPQRKEFDIFATMDAAKEVGGDFYDFYFVDNDKVCFLIADVSGKGIPAAMFMMGAKTLIKGFAEAGKDTAEVLRLTNKKLCINNEESMFVTCWIGILDLKTGGLEFANAGHNPPIIRRSDGDVEYLTESHGFVLGLMDDVSYKKNSLRLSKGDKLYLYTDGVTEATNVGEELFGEDRLYDVIKSAGPLHPREICLKVKDEVDVFVGDAPQFDDITMLCISYFAKEETVINTKATLAELQKVTDFAEGYFTSQSVPYKTVISMNIAVDEIFSNIAKFSGASYAEVSCELTDDMAILKFEDDGVPFDPTKRGDVDVSLDLDERQVGGMGILMVKKSMDLMNYQYKNGVNILTIGKKFK